MTVMLKANHHFADCPWSEFDLAQVEAHANELRPAQEPPGAQDAGVGHNQAPSGSFQDDADAIKRIGTIITSFKRLGLALDDPRCQRPHLRILYRLMKCLNRETGTTFLGRKALAEDAGVDIKTVENVLYDLRRWGHIDWEKRTDPNHAGKLLHYTLPITRYPEQLITEAIYALRGESTRPNGYSQSPSQQAPEVPAPTGTSAKPPSKKTKPRSQIASDWQPSAEARAWVQANYVASDKQIAEQAEYFRNHHQGKGSLMANWTAAWRTWWGNGFHRIPKRANGAASKFEDLETRIDAALRGPQGREWMREMGEAGARSHIRSVLSSSASSSAGGQNAN